MENEKIFVLVPVYKVEAYLERCIDSILNQTYTNWELILVDDGSPDNCGTICDAYTAKDSRIQVIHQENGGLSAARNAGIEYALKNGNPEQDWINFIDSDDFVHPKYLEYLYRAVKEAGTEISSCGFDRTQAEQIEFAGTDEMKYECLTPEEYWCKDRINATVAWGKLYKLSLIASIRFPVEKYHEDEFTTYMLLFQQAQISVIWKSLYGYFMSRNSIMRMSWHPKRLAALDALGEQLAFFEENGYRDAYKRSLIDLIKLCIGQLAGIRRESPTYDHLIQVVKQRQRNTYKTYIRTYGVWEFIGYWYEIRIKKPVKRILESKTFSDALKRQIRRFFRG